MVRDWGRGRFRTGPSRNTPSWIGPEDTGTGDRQEGWKPAPHPHPLTGLCVLLLENQTAFSHSGLPALTTSGLSDLRPTVDSGKTRASYWEG